MEFFGIEHIVYAKVKDSQYFIKKMDLKRFTTSISR